MKSKEEILDKIIEDLPMQEYRGQMTKDEWYGWFEEAFDKGYNQALQLQQTGVSTCFLEDYEDHFFEVKYKQVSCCKIAPITDENYCPNCGKKILK